MWPQSAASRASRSEFCDFDSIYDDDDDLDEYTPVIHPFGRGEFREMAEKAIIPDILMKQLQQQQQSTLLRGMSRGSQLPCAVTRPRGRGRARILQRMAGNSVRPGAGRGAGTQHTVSLY